MKLNYVARETRSILSLDRISDDHYKITRISVLVPHRQKGIASKLLRQCLCDADIAGVTLSLEPIPTLESGEDLDERRAQLISWYEKNGFVESSEPDEKGFVWVRKPTTHKLFAEALRIIPTLTPNHLSRLALACVDELTTRK